MRFLKIGCHPDDTRMDFSFEWYRDNEVAMGWNDLGDLKALDSHGKLTEDRVAKWFSDVNSATATKLARVILMFYHADEDVVFVIMKGKKLLGLMDRVQPYHYRHERKNTRRFAHCHSGRWLKCFGEEDRLPYETEGFRITCWEITDKRNVKFLTKRYLLAKGGKTLDGKGKKKDVPTPHENLEKLRKHLEGMTEAERKTEASRRLGQRELRRFLLECKGCCSVTGIGTPDLLTASHIKGWCESSVDEKLDVENVLLLAKNYDAVFDKHLISFDAEDGHLITSKRVKMSDLLKLGVDLDASIPTPSGRMKKYLAYHAKEMLKKDKEV